MGSGTREGIAGEGEGEEAPARCLLAGRSYFRASCGGMRLQGQHFAADAAANDADCLLLLRQALRNSHPLDFENTIIRAFFCHTQFVFLVASLLTWTSIPSLPGV